MPRIRVGYFSSLINKGAWPVGIPKYRAVDKEGHTIDFLLRAQRDKEAAMRFFEKAMCPLKCVRSSI
ncbi:MAG: hypothetical protein B7X93_12710 [Hydrogenophilales bacterium 17-61-9]|nr:MAG: hypothetical protein B7X93_12710 [Hydrogenophilales bacterium 17-61-9]